MSHVERNKKWLGYILLSGIYLFSRLLNLDSDIPIWRASYYSPIDEFYYTISAFDAVEGSDLSNGQYAAAYLNLVQQLITSLSLLVCGDNYYGLRMPSVVAGYIVLSSFYWVVLKRFGFVPALCFGLLLISEFSFSLATRIAEPTIFRLAAVSLLILLFTSRPAINNRQTPLWMGAATGIAWCFIYPTNAFVVLAGLCIVMVSSKDKFWSCFYYCTGIAGALLAYLLILYFIDLDVERNMGVFQALTVRVSAPKESGAWLLELWRNIKSIQHANFLIRNPIFQYAVTSSALLFLALFWRLRHSLKSEDYVVLIFILAFIAQTAFVNDYPQRKLIILFPLLLYFCFMVYSLLPLKLLPARLLNGAGVSIVVVMLISLLSVTSAKIYAAPKFKYKTAMQDLQYLNGERVIGGWGYGFRLYNTYKPYLNKYAMIYSDPEGYYKLLEEGARQGETSYVIEYDDPKIIDRLAKVGYEKYRLVFKSNDAAYPDVYLFKHNRV